MNKEQRDFIENILKCRDKENLSVDSIEKGCANVLLRLAIRTYSPYDNVTLYRVVTYENRPSESRFFRSRLPSDVVGYQRCNVPGSSMLYCCDSFATGLAEVSPKKGDVIYLCEYRLKNQITVVDMTQNLSNDQGVFNSLRDAFRERCDHSSSSKYKVTAVLSQKIIQGKIRSLGRNVDGIIYPSVKQGAGFCLAVSHESELVNLKLTSVSEFSFNGYGAETICTGRSLGVTGNVYWEGE